MNWLESLDQFFLWADNHPRIATLLSVLAIVAGALFLWGVVLRVAGRARRGLTELLARTQQSRDALPEIALTQRRLTALRLVVNGAQYALFVCALLLVLTRLGFKLDSLLLPAGFLGAALGLGAQNLVRDVISGLFIVFEGQFSVHDVVEINNVLGTVEEVGLRVTRVRDSAGQIHYFPNGAITAIARYPRRNINFVLLISLAQSAQREAAAETTVGALTTFNAIYHVLTAPAEPAPAADDAACLRFNLPVHPARVAVVREKLPAFLNERLQSAQLEGAQVEVIDAPSL